MKIELTIKKEQTGVDFTFSNNFNIHVFTQYDFLNVRFDIPFPIYFQHQDISVRKMIKYSIAYKNLFENNRGQYRGWDENSN